MGQSSAYMYNFLYFLFLNQTFSHTIGYLDTLAGWLQTDKIYDLFSTKIDIMTQYYDSFDQDYFAA